MANCVAFVGLGIMMGHKEGRDMEGSQQLRTLKIIYFYMFKVYQIDTKIHMDNLMLFYLP